MEPPVTRQNYILHQNSCSAILEQVHLGIIGAVAISHVNQQVSRGLSRCEAKGRHRGREETVDNPKQFVPGQIPTFRVGRMERWWVTAGPYLNASE